jgi:hypothetical protein
MFLEMMEKACTNSKKKLVYAGIECQPHAGEWQRQYFAEPS